MSALYLFIQITYWLALSTWFGSVLFLAVAWPVIYRTVREADPVLPEVLSVNLEGQHGSLLAGTIFANPIGMLTRGQFIFAGAMLITMRGQVSEPVEEWAAAVPHARL